MTAASPSPSPAAAVSPSAPPVGGDPCSPGEGPGFVGDPAFAILAMLGIGVASLVLTYLYIRVTPRAGKR